MNTPVVFKYMIPNENTERPDVVILCEGKAISLEFKTFEFLKEDWLSW